MTIFIYIVIFMIGTLIGSFCTLAVYRLPINKDITHERSFCPKCNHKLNFLDLIPILSYLLLRGKCRYCKEKIRPRYLILEVLAGLLTVIYFFSFKLDLYSLDYDKLISILAGIFYITGLIIIAGIDKEKKQLQKSVVIYNFVITMLYIIYLFVVGCTNINRYAIYLFFMLTLIVIYIVDKKHTKKRTLPIGFFVCIMNIVVMFLYNILTYYII